MRSSLPKFADTDFSLSENDHERRHLKRIKEQCRAHERMKISLPTGKQPSKPWKVTEGQVSPLWIFERDENGKVTKVTQTRPQPGTMDTAEGYSNRKFRVTFTGRSPILVGGEHIEAPTEIECFGDTALVVSSAGGTINEEFAV